MHNRSAAARFRASAFGLFCLLILSALIPAQAQEAASQSDVLSQLAAKLERGEATLEYKEGAGYLPSLLRLLDLNVDSQTLVFSKTSLQQALINPANPRA